MVLLDTNVLSELMRLPVAAPVELWAAGQRVDLLYTTTLSQAEILYGLETMAAGRRRDDLIGAARTLFSDYLGERILPFDSAAAHAFTRIAAKRCRAGRPIGTFDAQIAAIALAVGATVATRNVTDFQDCGVSVINPWDE